MKLEELISKHPMLQNVECGVYIGDGWCDLVDQLCSSIERLCEETQITVLVVGQVKEKFGGLRFILDTWPEDRILSIRVQAWKDFAQGFSFKICEDCGNPGKLRSGGWIRTLCDVCEIVDKRRMS